jgi:hypothetical protein
MNPSKEWEWKPEPPPKDDPQSVQDVQFHLDSIPALGSFRNSTSAYSETAGASQPSLTTSLPSDSKSYMERMSLVDLERIERIALMIRKHKEYNTTTTGDIRIPKRDVSQYAIPDSKESAKQQLLSLPPLDLESKQPFRKLVKEAMDNVSNSSPNLSARPQSRSVPILESKDTFMIKDKSLKPEPLDFARNLYEENVEGFTKEMVAPILGKSDDYHCRVLVAYMNHFDFSKISIDNAFRYIYLM